MYLPDGTLLRKDYYIISALGHLWVKEMPLGNMPTQPV